MSNPVVELSQIRKSFGKREILRGISFFLEPGRITAIAGPNASGKTTLMKCLLGLVLPDSGSITLGGKPIDKDSDYRRAIGYVPQTPDFPPYLAVAEIFTMLEGLRRQTAARKRELIDYFELSPFLGQPFGQLSGGTKQKVAAVIAMMFDAPILVLDEPTASLDPLSTVKIKDLLASEVDRGKTILLSSHAMVELEQLATELIYVIEGSAAFNGSIDLLKKTTREASLERAITRLISSPSPTMHEVAL